MAPLKIIVVGPKGAGKTTITNFLVGQADRLISDSEYLPTAGVRILEFETKLQGHSSALPFELWDSSGDQSYEACWRAIMSEADGVILIYNPDAPSQDQQLGDWFDYFVLKNGLRDEQSMIFAYRHNSSNTEKFRPPPLFTRVTAALTTSQSGPDMKSIFENFLKEIYNIKKRSS